MASNRSARRKAKHKASAYVRRALIHPIQALVVVTALFLAMTFGGLLLLAAIVVSEAFVLAALPRFAWFRHEVDEQLERAARSEAASARAALVGRMSEEHRMELEYIERLASQIRARSQPDDQDGGEGEWLGLGELLALYIRIAIAHHASATAFRPADRPGLDQHVANLEAIHKKAPASARAWVERRLDVARRRADVWDRAHDEQQRMEHALATIGAILRWMHEESATAPTRPLRDDLEHMIASWEQDGRTVRELSTLCNDAEPIDAEVLRLGRDGDLIRAEELGFAGACLRSS